MFLVYFCQNKKEYIYQHVQLFQRIPPKKKEPQLTPKCQLYILRY